MHSPTSLSRRHLLRLGATGAAAVAVGSHWPLVDGVAEAAPLLPAARRSTWNALHDPLLTADVGGRPVPMRLIEVADLPVADRLTGLQGHDGAFALRFTGPVGIPGGLATITSAELGTAELLLGAVGAPARGEQIYEAIIDRTIRIAGVNEEGSPMPVDAPAARAAQPAPSAAGASVPPAAVPRRPKTPALRRAAVLSTRSSRRLVADLSLADTRDVVAVRAVLMTGTTVVAKAASSARTPHRLKLSLVAPKPFTRKRYQLVVRMVGRDGSVTTARRSVRLG